jgi:hypothetical protein
MGTGRMEEEINKPAQNPRSLDAPNQKSFQEDRNGFKEKDFNIRE